MNRPAALSRLDLPEDRLDGPAALGIASLALLTALASIAAQMVALGRRAVRGRTHSRFNLRPPLTPGWPSTPARPHMARHSPSSVTVPKQRTVNPPVITRRVSAPELAADALRAAAEIIGDRTADVLPSVGGEGMAGRGARAADPLGRVELPT
jgi:hypothetical protein